MGKCRGCPFERSNIHGNPMNLGGPECDAASIVTVRINMSQSCASCSMLILSPENVFEGLSIKRMRDQFFQMPQPGNHVGTAPFQTQIFTV